jgi:ribosomal protein S18 acetylase RimI-like enzyme
MEENENFIHNKYGYCFYSIESDNTSMIFNLYVEPEYRRKGHAKHLIHLVINEIRETGYNKEIQIEAHPREDSIDVENLVAFYKRMGLKILEPNSD